MITQKHALLITRGTTRPVVRGYQGEKIGRLDPRLADDVNFKMSAIEALNLLGGAGYILRKEEKYLNGQIEETATWLESTSDDTANLAPST